jgi:hypothetical protein
MGRLALPAANLLTCRESNGPNNRVDSRTMKYGILQYLSIIAHLFQAVAMKH